MRSVEIRKAANGWLVFSDGYNPAIAQDPIVFTDWDKLIEYLKTRLTPEMKGIE